MKKKAAIYAPKQLQKQMSAQTDKVKKVLVKDAIVVHTCICDLT